MANASPEQPREEGYYDDEIDLREYLRVLWRHRSRLMAVSLLCAVVGLGTSVVEERMYEASAKLAVSRSKLDGDGIQILLGNFRPYLENSSIAQQVISELKLDELYELTPAKFFNGPVTVDEISNSTVLAVSTLFPDPEIAAAVANRMAELAVDKAAQLSREEAVQARDEIGEQLDGARKGMEEAEQKLRAYRTESQVELLRKDVDAALNARGGLMDLLVQIEAERSRIAEGERELATRERIGTVKRSIDSNTELLEAARQSMDPRDLLGLEVRNEFVDSVYESLDQQVATSRTTLAALEKQKSELIDVRKLNDDQLVSLSRLYEVESRLARLELDRDLAQQVYSDVARRYETARLDVAGRSAQLQIVDSALVPDEPVSRHAARNTALGLVIGLMLSVMGVLLYNAMAVPLPADEAGKP